MTLLAKLKKRTTRRCFAKQRRTKYENSTMSSSNIRNSVMVHSNAEQAVYFDVGSRVHPGSWGKRVLTVRSSNRALSDHPGTKTKKHPLWTARDFVLGRIIGAGHFGTIYSATYIPQAGNNDDNGTGSSASSEHSITKYDAVAVKRFAKSDLQSTCCKGDSGRALQLLSREVNIQSQ